MTLRTCGIVGSVLFALVMSLPVALAGLFDDPPAPATKQAPGHVSTQPSATGPESEYRNAIRKARVTYCQALVAADEKLLGQLDVARKAATKSGDDNEAQRLDRRSEAAAARLREDQAALASAQANERPRIVSASFGTGTNWADVTEQVKRLAESSDAVRANPDTLGADPSPGWRKQLEIVYIQDGRRRTVMINEDSEIRVQGLIPAESESR
ncbi:MAG TPA: hypothetical protein VGI81_07275 [Tepidisphaeraceae bacterium]|jgi:hypothetical protein